MTFNGAMTEPVSNILPTQSLPISSLSSPSTSLAISPSGTHLYAASLQGVAVYDISSLTQVAALNAPSSGAIKALAFSSDGQKLFTAHQDAKIRAWKTRPSKTRHRLVSSLPTKEDILRRFPFPGNYTPVRRHVTRLWIRHVDAVTSLAVSNGLIFSVSWDKTLKIWDAKSLRCLQSITAHDDAVNAVAVSADGAVYTASSDGRIRVWRRLGKNYALAASLEKHESTVNALTFSPDGKLLCSGGGDGRILVWEGTALTATVKGHEKAVMCMAYEGAVLVSGSTDKTVRVWRRVNGGGGFFCVSVLLGHVGGLRAVAAFRVYGEEEEYRVFSGSSDGEVRAWLLKA